MDWDDKVDNDDENGDAWKIDAEFRGHIFVVISVVVIVLILVRQKICAPPKSPLEIFKEA